MILIVKKKNPHFNFFLLKFILNFKVLIILFLLGTDVALSKVYRQFYEFDTWRFNYGYRF